MKCSGFLMHTRKRFWWCFLLVLFLSTHETDDHLHCSLYQFKLRSVLKLDPLTVVYQCVYLHIFHVFGYISALKSTSGKMIMQKNTIWTYHFRFKMYTVGKWVKPPISKSVNKRLKECKNQISVVQPLFRGRESVYCIWASIWFFGELVFRGHVKQLTWGTL